VFPGANDVPRFAISPDGRKVVFTATASGKYDRLYVRDLGAADAVLIPGMETPPNAGIALQQPFFSPDGRFVAFFSEVEGTLKRVPLAGGPVERLATLPTANISGTWHGDVILVASTGTRGVQRVAASGGALTPVTTLDQSRGETAHLWPQFLPDGQRFLYLATGAEPAIYVANLAGGVPVRLVEAASQAWFARPNRVLYLRESALVMDTIDLERLTLAGGPMVIAESPRMASNTWAGVAVSDAGVLVVATGKGAPAPGISAVSIARVGPLVKGELNPAPTIPGRVCRPMAERWRTHACLRLARLTCGRRICGAVSARASRRRMASTSPRSGLPTVAASSTGRAGVETDVSNSTNAMPLRCGRNGCYSPRSRATWCSPRRGRLTAARCWCATCTGVVA